MNYSQKTSGFKFKNKKNLFLIGILLVMGFSSVFCQVTQTIKGKIMDSESQVSLPGATVVILNSNPLNGATTNIEGEFRIENVPVGRHDLQVSFLGYDPVVLNIQVNSGKEVYVDIPLKESITGIDEVVIKSHSKKDKAQNTMATLSARTFSVEEANRYAGGADDPGRLVSAFAGVSTVSSGDNAIVIRGNSPKGVLWRMEGADIPNPNHFGDNSILGGGFICAINSNVLSNSDFFTGAFPAEYGNALAGVFDMKMRTGNKDKREYIFQAGLLGIDFATEGPFVKGRNASYLLNYRYSTFSLLKTILGESDLPSYQDISFKVNIPTKKLGVFNLWSFGGYDFVEKDAKADTLEWKYEKDKETFRTVSGFGAIGLTNNYIIGKKTYIKTSLVTSGRLKDYKSKEMDNTLALYEKAMMKSSNVNYTLSSLVNHKFNASAALRMGINYKYITYNIDKKYANNSQSPLNTITDEIGSSSQVNCFAQSKINLTKAIVLNPGIHLNYFGINNKFSIEPRMGLSFALPGEKSINLAYGMHSQTELLHYYLVEKEVEGVNSLPNENLDISKAQHLVVGLDMKLTSNTRLKIEPYYQHLYDIPVGIDTNFSMINLGADGSFDEELVNNGYGRNYGIDFTVERFLHKGFYYLVSGSVFESLYKCSQNDAWKSTVYNRNFVLNILAGKEWQVGKNNNNILGINGRLYFMGGQKYTPVNESASVIIGEVAYHYDRIYENQYPSSYRFDFTLSYRKNKEKYSSVITLQMLNTFGSKDFNGFLYNFKTNQVEKDITKYTLPVISYRIEF
jgi:hypothetical protein